jgi:hypothetical protein
MNGRNKAQKMEFLNLRGGWMAAVVDRRYSVFFDGDKKSHVSMYRVTNGVTEQTKGVTRPDKWEKWKISWFS